MDTLKELNDILPEDYVHKGTKYLALPMDFFGIIFEILAIHDVDRLLEFWKKEFQKNSMVVYLEKVSFFREYGIDFVEYAKKHSIKIILSRAPQNQSRTMMDCQAFPSNLSS